MGDERLNSDSETTEEHREEQTILPHPREVRRVLRDSVINNDVRGRDDDIGVDEDVEIVSLEESLDLQAAR